MPFAKFGKDERVVLWNLPRLTKLDITHMLFNDEEIEFVDQFKYLGVILDGSLKFKPHVDYLVRKVTPKLRTLGQHCICTVV